MNRQPEHPCPHCRSYARVRTPAGEVACARCSTLLTPLPYVGRSKKPPRHRTPLRIGMETQLGGETFYAVGRIIYKSVGEAYYWEEWVLLHPDGDMRYLEYDEGKWTLSEAFHPASAPSREELEKIKPDSEGDVFATIRINNLNVRVVDAGGCEVHAVEGEIPWDVKPKDRFRYVDGEGGGAFYSAEIPPESSGDPVEWYKGRRLDDRAVFTMFNLRDLLDRLQGQEQKRGGRNFFGGLCLFAALLAFMGWLYGLTGGGRIVAQGSHPINQIGTEGVRFGPYTLEAPDRVYRLNLSSDLREAAAWVGATLEHPDAGEFFDVSGEFWDETGYDSDGYWHESSVNAREDFRVSQPSTVFVRLYAEPEAAQRTSGALASFSLQEGVLYPAYLGWLGLAYLGLSLVMFISASAGLSSKVWEGMGEVKQVKTRPTPVFKGAK